jgi:hypothetical protein
MSQIIFVRNGNERALTSKPFWVSHAHEQSGVVYVARIAASSTDGAKHYLLDLTEEELSALMADKKVMALPDNPFVGSVLKPRPKTNKATDVRSEASVNALMDRLQNEGYSEKPTVDKTPWQKGDDIDA